MMRHSTLGGILTSIAIHLVLFYGFHSLQFQFKEEEPKFISLTFAEFSGPILQTILQATPPPIEDKTVNDNLIQLPKIKFYTDEAPIPATEKSSEKLEDNALGDLGDRSIGEKRSLPFTISGEVSTRTILWKVLPQYPKGLQQEATLRFRFSVSPEGSVHDIIPLQKAAPQLEAITIQALYKWKFTPLPPPSKDMQEGVISFIYKLE
jgi:hypothetical protein